MGLQAKAFLWRLSLAFFAVGIAGCTIDQSHAGDGELACVTLTGGLVGCAIQSHVVSDPSPFSPPFAEGAQEIGDGSAQALAQVPEHGSISSHIGSGEGGSHAAEDSRRPVHVAAVEEKSSESIPDTESFYDPFAAQVEEEPYDPWESFNTKIFAFNRKADQYVLKPLATGYEAVMPDPLEKGISNAFHNLGVLPRLINNLLQAKYQGAGLETGRFLINSTLGIAGLFDVAKTMFGMETPDVEDTGQTFAVYGADPGPYLVLPLLPPLTARDAVGSLGDLALDPANYLLPFSAIVGERGGDVVNDRSLNLELFQGVEETTLDLYSAVRDAYLQKRAKAIRE